MNQRIKKIVLLIALPFVLWLFYSHTAYWHFHMTPAGVVIQHSHPYTSNTASGTPFQKHTHTDFEYSLLAQLSNVAGLMIFLLALFFMLQAVVSAPSFYRSNLQRVYDNETNPLRGPPFIS
jgi:hypothetical protein